MEEVYGYYLEYAPEATRGSVFTDGVERFEEGQKLGLCPDKALETSPLAFIQVLTALEEEPDRVIHTLRVTERAAQAADAPIDLALWCGFELPDYRDVCWDYLPQQWNTVSRVLLPQPDTGISERAKEAAAALVWENAVRDVHDTNYLLYERLIDRILAAKIDPTYLRIRPVFTGEAASTPLTTKRRHSQEGILADAEARDLSPDTPLIILDSDTTFVGKQTLTDIVRHVQKRDKPLVKARTIYTGEPNSVPIAKRKQSERLAALFAKAQYLAEDDIFQNGGELPYLEEVGTATSLRYVCRSLGFSTPQPGVIGESRAYIHNIQDNLGIMPQDAVQFLPRSRVGTSNRRIIQDMERWLARTDRHSKSAITQPSEEYYSHYRSAIEQEKADRVLADNLGADSRFFSKFHTSEAAEPLTPEDILTICHDAIISYRKKFSKAQTDQLLRLAGRLGLLEGPVVSRAT